MITKFVNTRSKHRFNQLCGLLPEIYCYVKFYLKLDLDVHYDELKIASIRMTHLCIVTGKRKKKTEIEKERTKMSRRKRKRSSILIH